MKKLILLAALFAAVALSACKYDDGDIWKSVHGLENRVAALEELCKQMNTNISSLQTIVTALQNNDYVTGVIPVVKNGETIGYTISFTKSAPITIYHGENGKDGKDGERGSDGKDGHTPVIGVRLGSDGIYYWTLDGEWLLDNSGNKIKAEGRDGQDGKDGTNGNDGKDGKPGADGKDGENGKDGQNGADGKDGENGKDGIIPQLKIENGYWYVSTDNGATWTNLGKATGEDGKDGKDGADGNDGIGGDSIFKGVTQDENNVYFTLADDETIVLPKKQSLSVTFAEGNSLQFDINETKTIDYTITGGSDNNVVKAEMQNLDGAYTLRLTQTTAAKGKITVTANVPTKNNVIVSVSNGSHTIMAAIAVMMKSSLDAITVETPGTLADLIADYDKDTITELTVIGNLNSSDISTLKSIPNLVTLDMENVNLEELPSDAFKNKISLVSVKLPQILKRVGDSAFYGCNGLTGITIPDSVTEIGGYAFRGCSGLTGIAIPDSVTEIGGYAFYECSSLISVKIGNSVTVIGRSAFSGCSGLTGITIPDGVTLIDDFAFNNCSSLISVKISNSVTEIGRSAFSGCSSLTGIKFGNSVTEIGSYAFYNCRELTDITIPDGVTTIGNSAFFGCSSLTSITIPDSVTEIGGSAFRGCSGLTSITIPDGVTTIGSYAFSGCSSLTSITIPDGVTEIGRYAFSGCSGLTGITIPDGVTLIDFFAFNDCSSLTSVTIGSSVESIGDWAFSGCSSLTSVYCKIRIPVTILSSDTFSNRDNCILYVPVGRKGAYTAAKYWKEFKTIEEMEF